MANYHGPLYERACSVFQRRVKQVYFQLNPFLERTNVKDDEAECYQPSSKFVIPLKSIVVCEQFDQDQAKDWKVLNPEQFWDYLYSASWGDDCSLRVLEGELLELLMMLLCVMEKNEDITVHNTFAYAENKRRVNKCYVNSANKEEEYFNETLLVEFIYYGVNNKVATQTKNKSLVSWKDYKELAAKAVGLSKLVDIVDLVGSSKKKKKVDNFMSLIRSPKSSVIGPTESQDVRLEALTAMRWQDGVYTRSAFRRKAHLSGRYCFPGTGSMLTSSTDQTGNVSPQDKAASNDGSELLARMDEILFDKSKKVGRGRRTTTFFGGLLGRRQPPGDEFYINQLSPKHKDPFYVEEFLREKKNARMSEKEREIKEVEDLTERFKLTKLENSIEESRQNSDGPYYKPLLKVYDRRASFGEFYRYLEEENKFDPRFKKGSSKRKKPSEQKIKDKKDSRMSVGVKKSLKIHRSSIMSVAGKKGSIGSDDDVTKPVNTPRKMTITDRQRFAKEVEGVTDSQPAKNHCLQYITSSHKESEAHMFSKASPLRGRRLNSMFSDAAPSSSLRRGDETLFSILPKITSPILERASVVDTGSNSTPPHVTPATHSSPRSHVYNRSSYSKRTSPTIESDSDIESSESVIDDEEDDYLDTIFDTRKLNRKYSIEKIRAIKSKKEKKPPVLNILKKFCRVNRMMNSLSTKPSSKVSRKSVGPEHRKSLAEANKAKQTAKAFGMFRRLNRKAASEVRTELTIGKIKHFEFLKYKDHVMKMPEINFPNFKTSSIEDFKANLLQSMGDFVIRKEMITSSYTSETVTTVTFTRPAAYIRMHQLPKDL